MSDREEVFLFDELDEPLKVVAKPGRSEVGAFARGLEMIRGVQILLTEILHALKRLGGDTNGHASASRTLTSGTTAVGLKCDTEFTHAQPFVVTADVDTPGVQAQLTVEWRLDGSIIQRTIDVAAGASIGGVAEAVTASVKDITTQGVYAPGIGAAKNYVATVTISPGVRVPSAVPPVQNGGISGNVLAGGNLVYQVPKGANGFYLYGESQGSPPQLYADQFTAGAIGSTAGLIVGTAVNTLMTDPIPLVAGSAQVRVTNEGANTANFTLIWTIDG